MMRFRVRFSVIALVAVMVAVGTWSLRGKFVQAPLPRTQTATPSDEQQAITNGRAPGFHKQVIASSPQAPKPTDYRQLVNMLLPAARSGDKQAQYQVAFALHYCEDYLHSHFISAKTGTTKTREEVLHFISTLDGNTKELSERDYRRCQSFLDDMSILRSYHEWLSSAASAGYAPAQFMEADLILKQKVLQGDPAELEKAREMAASASMGADPAVLFGMADFVDASGKTREKAGQLIAAWWLLGCQRGYDCTSDSDAAYSVCSADPQCANRPTIQEHLQWSYGAQYVDVEQLAEQIGLAIDSGNVEAVKKFL